MIVKVVAKDRFMNPLNRQLAIPLPIPLLLSLSPSLPLPYSFKLPELRPEVRQLVNPSRLYSANSNKLPILQIRMNPLLPRPRLPPLDAPLVLPSIDTLSQIPFLSTTLLRKTHALVLSLSFDFVTSLSSL